MNTIEMIEIMHAFLDGERIQYRERHHGGRWYDMDCVDPLWDFANDEYRIKPVEICDDCEQFMRLTIEQINEIVVTALLDAYHLEKDTASKIALKGALKVFGVFETRPEDGIGK